MPGRVVRKATYIKEYHELTKKDGIPFVPGAVWKDLFSQPSSCSRSPLAPFTSDLLARQALRILRLSNRAASGFLLLVALCSALALAASMETPALLIGPVIVILGLLLLPFLFGEGEKSWRRRPVAVLTILLVAVALGTFTRLAGNAPWSPVMDAWSGIPIPAEFLHNRSALERQGALVFQVKQCHNCHSLDNQGGKRGPALDAVAVRLTQDQLIRQVIQAWQHACVRKNLSPAETTALVAFLETLHPAGQSPARDASRAIALEPDSATPSSGHP